MSVEVNGDNPGTAVATAARWKLPVIVVTATTLLVGLGIGAWLLYGSPRGPLSPPDKPWPTAGGISVYLCSSAPWECGGHATTAAQTREIERTLREMPELSEVRFESQAEAFRRFKESYAQNTENKALISATEESDMPESFLANTSTTAGDHIRKIEALPGVSQVFVHGTGFWVGKADLGIHLCPEGEEDKGSRCFGRGAPTEKEKTAVYEALHSIDGVGTIYFEQHEHATEDFLWRVSARRKEMSSDAVPESFYVVLDAPKAAEQVKRETGKLPGVKEITEARQWE